MGVWERRFYRVLNGFMRVLLRSRLHRLGSGRVLLLEFRGRRSGRNYSMPASFWQAERDLIVCLTRTKWSRWWQNLDGTDVAVWLHGQRRYGRAELVSDPVHRRVLVSSFLAHNAHDAHHYEVASDPHGRLGLSACQALADAADTKVIAIALTS